MLGQDRLCRTVREAASMVAVEGASLLGKGGKRTRTGAMWGRREGSPSHRVVDIVRHATLALIRITDD